MTRVHHIATAVAAAVAAASTARGQQEVHTVPGGTAVYTVTQDTGGDIPLASKHFQWPDLPYQADTGNGPRGTQQGYNICNSTTQNQQSMCQTGFVNALDDFCLWGSPVANETVADVEEEMVAYCTKKKYGARLFPSGAIQGVQLIRTPDYIEIVGYVDQTALNLQADDTGGEEDPHGADQRGNPLGSLVYSSAFNNSAGAAYTQVTEWSYFVGSGIFCFKACDPAGPRAAQLCQHTYDRIGCSFNAPADYAAINGTFQSCLGEDQLPVGVYVDGGVTKTWQQPPESLGPITSIGYTASTPATSQCSQFTSANLYTETLTASTTSTPAPSSSSSASSSNGGAASGPARSSNNGGGSGATSPSQTGSAGSSSQSSSAAVPQTLRGVGATGGVVAAVVAGLVSVGIAVVA